MTITPGFTLEKKTNGLCQITLDRADTHNTIDDTLIKALLHTLQTLDQDPDVRVLILAATGKSFCAGADLHWMQRMHHASITENKQDALQLAHFFKTLYHFSKPTLCCVQGAAYGGGLGLIACCDMAIAVPSAPFCFSEVKLGLVAASIAPYVIAAIGERQTLRYFLTAEKFTAEDALRINLIHHVVLPEKLSTTGLAIAEKLLLHGPHAMKNTKHLIRNLSGKAIDETIEHICAESLAQTRASTEALEGIQAFLEKRAPKFTD